MDSKLSSEILKNFESLFESKENYDVIIQVGEEPNIKEIYAHSLVLRCQSNYFRTAFSSNWAEKIDGKYIFKKPNISSHTFEVILRYLYCGQVDLSVEKNGLDVLKLLISTDEFGLHTLNEHLQEFIVNNQKELLQNDTVGILEIIFQHESLTTLRNYCIETICQEPNILFGTDKILKLPAELLELLLKRDDLALKEIEIWNNLIKWTQSKHLTIDTDTSKWNREDSTLMGETISRFIPLIRFQDITSEDFSLNVLPYEDLLPKKLKHEILNSYLNPSTKRIDLLPSRMAFNIGKIDSLIINKKYMPLFASWIDRKNVAYDLERVPYNFNLILRGSRDGFSASSFHNKCDDKGATIVIAKIKGTNKIVGGYNPYSWSGNTNGNTNDSFLFLFDDYRSVDTGNLYRVNDKRYAVSWKNYYGVCFGYNGRWADLLMYSDGKWSSFCTYYPKIDISHHFEVDDYEVFNVIKK
ncbi:BTB/POZ domain-containing protein [Rhizophagus irregularis DAOM 181602=DAOM 197198]|uniref:Kelch-like protein 17 n=3 Tax=Rhizophagus irregularis TaxID=588596 RepID=A0A015J5M0_RHIIW|nr:hypothetical protein GLOIN_2v1789571 [Rhizophagus irregularis DAOM 181602=DAOM 197198]EXX50194.1 hypothetical protein RirG_273210 [Rhizophagus irregularis DAOM 197198w]POG59080.1 hypothetical protein GLOIN_2v1789571 [Rhizophagus irregularis DAOM 181602=DAOM 197198]GBC21635.1 BTB/POZ domain-containing protein [Rhizophagus irregularis DAOM 181602=DAOM 197198]|eukprot:XP_025165946.1 hypothetical protein GLOIN_2v1789571 [Rhizophagus irregularis DAOM 181602=DAOM 197198]